MRALAVVGVLCVAVGPSVAQERARIAVAVAPPGASSPEGTELGLLQAAAAASWLAATGKVAELHVKQIVRVVERQRLDPLRLDEPAEAARLLRALGATVLITGRISGTAGAWVLEVGGVDEKGALARARVALPAALPAAVEVGARALAVAAGKAALLDVPTKAAIGTASAPALAAYGSCYAVLIRQPISLETPTVLGTEELARAVRSCRQAVQADPAFEAGWAALGLALAVSGEDAQAVQALVRVHPERGAQPLYWLGRYWLVTRYQSPDKGLLVLGEAVKRAPGFLLARGYIAEHLMASGRFDEALAAWRSYAAELPRNAFLRGRVSAAQARLGRHDEAIAEAKEALALEPHDRDAILELGSRYLDAGKRPLAIATLEPAADGNARGELLLRLGWAYFDEGNLARAEALFRRADQVATLPSEWRTRARARADLARVYDSRGDRAAAEAAMRRALDEGAGPYLHTQHDRRLTQLLKTAETAPPKLAAVSGARLTRPQELSPFPIDPAGDVDLRARQFPTPPPQFELLRF